MEDGGAHMDDGDMAMPMGDDGMMMDGDGGGSMGMYFHAKVPEVLLFRQVVPASMAQYVGVCFLLVAIAFGNVALKAWRVRLEGALLQAQLSSTTSALLPKERPSFPAADNARRAALSLAVITTDYSLMLVVMTLNVGYFCSVVAGHALATFCLGHMFITPGIGASNALIEHNLPCCE